MRQPHELALPLGGVCRGGLRGRINVSCQMRMIFVSFCQKNICNVDIYSYQMYYI